MNKLKIIGFAIGPIGSAILGFITLPILAWYVSAEDIGRITMLQIIVSFSVVLFSLGLDQAYIREYHESKNKATLLKTVISPGLILILCSLLGIFSYSFTFLSKLLFEIDSMLFSILIAICLLSSFISRFLSLILRMQEKGLAFSMSQVLPKLLFLIIISLYIYYGVLFNFHKLLFAQIISIGTVFIIYTWNTRSEWLPAFSAQVNYIQLKQMLNFGLPLILGGIASWALMAMDRIFLRSLSNFEELGIYSMAVSVAAVASILSGIFSTIWAPTVFKWAAAGKNLDKINEVSEHLLSVIYFLLCLCGILSWLIPYLLPHTYIAIQYLLVACMSVRLFYMISETTAVGIAISRKTSFSLLASCIAAGINGIGNYLLIPTYGAAGAAVSTACSMWVFIICRTEFSCLVWRHVPRLKLYLTTFICLFNAVLFALVGKDVGYLYILIWILFFIFGFIFFKRSVILAKNEVINMYFKFKRSNE